MFAPIRGVPSPLGAPVLSISVLPSAVLQSLRAAANYCDVELDGIGVDGFK